MCQTARRILKPPHGVGRVIARPFIGTSGNYVRTGARRDFSLEPPGPTLLDVVSAAGMDVMACGKIDDIFAGKGITRSSHVAGNDAVFDAMLDFLRAGHDGLIFANLVDFDMKWGHRNDPEAFAAGLEHFDARLPELLDLLGPGDLVAICADHGNDPTTPSTDHSRESVPLLLYCPREPSPSKPAGVWLGERRTFADLGASIAHFLGLQWNLYGQSFMGMVP